MDSTKIWNTIVQHYKDNFGAKEDILQKSWELFFSELFHYSKIFGEIDAQRSITIGSHQRTVPDIIIKNNSKDLFNVELKQYSLPFTIDMEKQLKSYMDLLHITIGILICQNIYLYVYDFSKGISKKAEIKFTENNPDGIKFVELLQNGQFSEQKIEEFIDRKNAYFQNISKIRENLTKENIISILKKHFSENYTAKEIEEAFSNFQIAVHSSQQTAKPTPTDNSYSNKEIAIKNIRQILSEYHSEQKLIYEFNSPNSYLRFQTLEMSTLIPNTEQKGSWGTGARYLFWLGEFSNNSFKACFELGGWDGDEHSVEIMKKIISLTKPNDNKPNFRYKRIHTVIYNYTKETAIETARKAIDDLLNWEKEFIKKL
jgi:hypothetical protein